jgi:hypothetical protein
MPRCRQVRPRATAAPAKPRSGPTTAAPETFNWQPEREIVVGVRRKPNLASDVMARCAALYGPGTDEGDT